MTTELILASGSRARRQMLEAAGVRFQVVPADVDEDAHRLSISEHDVHGGPARVAQVLARVKAEEVSRRFPQALVIGGDQVLALGREIFTKPADLGAARVCLERLSAQMHQLHSAVALASAGAQVWSHLDTASLTMRLLSPAFVDEYLHRAGERVCSSVGAYELEGLGIQLFERVEGDYFTILGLPLLPLLAQLRRMSAIPT